MSEFQLGALGLFVVMTAIYVGAEIYAHRVLGPRRKPTDSSESKVHPAE